MKIVDLLEGAEKGSTTLGGFPVKVLHIQDSGQPEIDEEGVAEEQLNELVLNAENINLKIQNSIGVYFLVIEADDEKAVIRLVKE